MATPDPAQDLVRGIHTKPAGKPAKTYTQHLLAIGIDEYDHMPGLNNCVRDIKALIEVLAGRYGFAPERVHTLFNKEATGEKMVQLLEALPARLSDSDNLLIVFSGHGEYRPAQGEGFWAPADARPGMTKDLISIPELKMYLNPLPCHHLAVVVDACFSGALFRRYRSSGKSAASLEEPSRWGLTSGRLEPVLDGHPGMHSPFAESMIKHLRTSPEPMRIDELHQRIVQDLEQLGFNQQAPDCGYLDLPGNRRGVFRFEPLPEAAADPDWATYEVRLDQSVLRIMLGDIVEVQTDAVVSSDDTFLSMSSGVSAAILRAAGPKLRALARKLLRKPVQVGEVVETAGFDLAANYIFHAITLDYGTKSYATDQQIADMTRRCLELADERGLRRIAFPALGTGAAGLPFESTAQAMVNAICTYLLRGSRIESVVIVLHDKSQDDRKAGLQSFFQKAIRNGAAWSKLDLGFDRISEMLGVLGLEAWTSEAKALQDRILQYIQQRKP